MAPTWINSVPFALGEDMDVPSPLVVMFEDKATGHVYANTSNQ